MEYLDNSAEEIENRLLQGLHRYKYAKADATGIVAIADAISFTIKLSAIVTFPFSGISQIIIYEIPEIYEI